MYYSNSSCRASDQEITILTSQRLRYSGFQGNKLSAVDPNTKSKTAHVRYDTAEQAAVALEALNEFQIKRGWKMHVAYAAL